MTNEPKRGLPSHPEDAQFPPEWRQQRDDEISLIDLWLTLIRRRRWILGIAAAVFALGSVYGLIQQPSEKLTSTLQVAERDGEPIVSGVRSAARLERVKIPEARAAMEAEGTSPPSVEVEWVEDALLILLTSSAPGGEPGHVEELHQRLFDTLRQTQGEVLERERDHLERDLERAEAELKETRDAFDVELDGLRDRIADTWDELKALEEERSLLLRRHEELRRSLEEESDGERTATRSGLQQLHIDLRENREERALAQEQLRSLEQALRERQKERQDWVRRQQERIESLRNDLENLSATELLGLAVSGETNTGRAGLISALSAVLGLMLGVFGGFFREFLAHAHSEAAGER